jgi:hypothetical protein
MTREEQHSKPKIQIELDITLLLFVTSHSQSMALYTARDMSGKAPKLPAAGESRIHSNVRFSAAHLTWDKDGTSWVSRQLSHDNARAGVHSSEARNPIRRIESLFMQRYLFIVKRNQDPFRAVKPPDYRVADWRKRPSCSKPQGCVPPSGVAPTPFSLFDSERAKHTSVQRSIAFRNVYFWLSQMVEPGLLLFCDGMRQSSNTPKLTETSMRDWIGYETHAAATHLHISARPTPLSP